MKSFLRYHILQMISDLADFEVLNTGRFDVVEKSLSEPDVRRHGADSVSRRVPNGLLADPNTIRQLAVKCDEKLKIAMKTAEENAGLREQIAGLKQKLDKLQVALHFKIIYSLI
jgi:hypothetical protein